MQLEGADSVLKFLPPPVVIKPKPLWTGKQIMSLIIPDVNVMKNQEKTPEGRIDYAPLRDKMVVV